MIVIPVLLMLLEAAPQGGGEMRKLLEAEKVMDRLPERRVDTRLDGVERTLDGFPLLVYDPEKDPRGPLRLATPLLPVAHRAQRKAETEYASTLVAYTKTEAGTFEVASAEPAAE